jgi:hypothetical protein
MLFYLDNWQSVALTPPYVRQQPAVARTKTMRAS